jgi:hypothetical protein
MPDSLRSDSTPPNKVRLRKSKPNLVKWQTKTSDNNQCRRPYRLVYYKRLKCRRCRRCVCTVNSTYVAISVWYSTSPSKVAWRKKGKNQVPTSYITRFAVEFFLSYESLKSRKRRICFPTSYKSTYVAIPAIRPFCHSFCHSAIPSAIPPFRHSAIPPFRHSAISTIPTYKLPTYIQTYEVEKWDLNGLGRHFFNEINY